MRRLSRLLMLVLPFVASACFPSRPKASNSEAKATAFEPLQRCVALRGNGTHFVAHTAALAKITNRWGEVQAMAGGSSGTITILLYESILMNPAVNFLTGEDRNRAISLLLKSITGYAQEVMDAPEWKALIAVGTLAGRLKGESILDLPPDEFKKTAANLQQIFMSDDIRNLINPEIIDSLDSSNSQNPQDYKNKVEEVKKAAISLVNRL